jgi:putative polyhydroxyalkanoate system protein
MPKFEVDIPHALAPDEVKARLDRATTKIESTYGATCTWTGTERLSVSRRGFDAVVTIQATRVHVEMTLGFLLVALAPAIRAGLSRELSALLAEPGPAMPPPSSP